jgi:hypothetical protein
MYVFILLKIVEFKVFNYSSIAVLSILSESFRIYESFKKYLDFKSLICSKSKMAINFDKK